MDPISIRSSKDQIVFHDQVRLGYEWMTVTASLRHHDASPVTHARAGLALSMTTSFGVFGYEWRAIPFDEKTSPEHAVLAFLLDLDCEDLLGKVLRHDAPVPDFQATVSAITQLFRSSLASEDPESVSAQTLREAFIEFDEAVEAADEGEGDELRISRLLDLSCLRDLFSEELYELPQTGPSRRRLEAEAFHERLWRPYLDARAASLQGAISPA